jgi:hypothetical protein
MILEKLYSSSKKSCTLPHSLHHESGLPLRVISKQKKTRVLRTMDVLRTKWQTYFLAKAADNPYSRKSELPVFAILGNSGGMNRAEAH